MINKVSSLAVVVAALVSVSSNANAAVEYDFTALSAYPLGGETITGSFSVITPGFISADASFTGSAVKSCSVAMAPAIAASCSEQNFSLSQDPAHATIEFGSLSAIGDAHTYYYFDRNAFDTLGTHASEVLGDAQAGILKVSEVSAVPEPTSAAMLLASGLGLLAVARRKGNRA